MLFTDIEGSTRLLKQLGDRYGELLSDQRRLLRGAFADHAGREMDTQGDAFFYAFARARNAVEAAVDAQRALAAHAWPDGAECRVRMGLHTGEPSVGEEGYHGIGLHRGARIAAAAHGGKILLSSTTAELIQDDLPAGVTLRDLGPQKLKDIDRPERIYQVVAAGLASSFPPLRTAAAGSRASRRRPVLVGAAALMLAAAVTSAVIVGTRGGAAHASATKVSADAVGIFDPATGGLSSQIAVGASPSAVTFGAGSIWVANLNDGSVTRIDPDRQVAIDTIHVGNGPDGIAYGGGFVWVTNGLDGTVTKLDPQTNTQVDSIYVGNAPAGVALDAGDVWVANADDGTVSRWNPSTRNVQDIASVGTGAEGIAIANGTVWVTNETTGIVTRIDERSGSVLGTVEAGSGASAVAIGDGSAWVTDTLAGTVTRIDPVSGNVQAVIPVGDGPNALAVLPGAVWVSDELAGTLTRIDPESNSPGKPVETGNQPEGLVVGSGALFVAVKASGIGHRGGTLTILTAPSSLATDDPARAYASTTIQLAGMTNDGLTGLRRAAGAAGSSLVPDLAVSLPSPTDQGLTYTFELRPGIRYSNGSLVRPLDFRRGIERSLAQSFDGDYFSHIVGAKECLAEPKRPCDLSHGIVAGPGTHAVTFHLSSPDSEFLDELAIPGGDAVPVGTPDHPQGPLPATGPYKVVSFGKRRVVLVRNPRFREWSPAAQPAGFPDRIVFLLGGTPDSRIAAVEHGAGDLALDSGGKPSPAVVTELRTQHASQLEIEPSGLTLFLSLNTRIAPFDNLEARQAFNLAVDRQRLLTLSTGPGLGQVTCQVLPPNFAGFRRYCPYTADPQPAGAWTAPDLARARRLVRASGTAGQSVTVWIPPWIDYSPPVGRYAVSVLESLGYRAQLETPKADPFQSENKLGLQAGFSGWYADYPTAAGFFVNSLTCRSYSPNGVKNTNFAEFCDPAIDREIALAERLQTTDSAAATKEWAKVDRDVTDQAPWVAYGTADTLEFRSKRIGNYQYNPQTGTLLDQLWVR